MRFYAQQANEGATAALDPDMSGAVRIDKLAQRLGVPVGAVLSALHSLGRGTFKRADQHVTDDAAKMVELELRRNAASHVNAPVSAPLRVAKAQGTPRGADIDGDVREAFGQAIRPPTVDEETLVAFEDLMRDAGVRALQAPQGTTRTASGVRAPPAAPRLNAEPVARLAPPLPPLGGLPQKAMGTTLHEVVGTLEIDALRVKTERLEADLRDARRQLRDRAPTPVVLPPTPVPPVGYLKGLEQALAAAQHRISELEARTNREADAHRDTTATLQACQRDLAAARAETAQGMERAKILSSALADAMRRTEVLPTLERELAEARVRLAELDARPPPCSAYAAFEQRGLRGEDEAWLLLNALHEAGRHGELLRAFTLARPDEVEAFLDERVILLGPDDAAPAGTVGVKVPSDRSEAPPVVRRAMARLAGEILAQGPRADGGRREILIAGGRAYERRQLATGMPHGIAVRTCVNASAIEARDPADLVVLWRCPDAPEEASSLHPRAISVGHGGLAAMLHAVADVLHGVTVG